MTETSHCTSEQLTAQGYNGPWPAPIKLNLFLHITGRRDDGYHDLQTLFQLLDYGDDLYFRPRPDAKITRHGSTLPGLSPENDLITRAARLLRKYGSPELGADIYLIKRSPLGGGVGGGSSDAATTLLALNRLWNLNLPIEHLAQLATILGADVPVFVCGHSAWAEGRGEILHPATLPPRWYLVLTPDEYISTARLFAETDLKRDCPRLSLPLSDDDIPDDNVFTPLVLRQSPAVRHAYEWLKQKGLSPQMTGTGSCIFSSFESKSDAESIRLMLPPELNGFVARGLNVSPLLEKLDPR